MSDYLVRGLGLNDEVRIFAVDTTDTINEAVRRHGAYPTAAAALGRSMSAGVIMGAMLKGEDKATHNRGRRGRSVHRCGCYAHGHVRGYLAIPRYT